jgi:hypothetical protein
MEGFNSFDWDHDGRWLAYLRRIEVTSNTLEAAKRKWYKKEVDPSFDANAARWPRDLYGLPARSRPVFRLSWSARGVFCF